jgi:hypothetical protein
MKSQSLLAGLLLLGACGSSGRSVQRAGPPEPAWAELLRQANGAGAKGAFPEFRELLTRLYRTSGSAQILLALASADARVGDRDAAFAHLQQYASLRLDADVNASPAISALRNDPRWPTIQAALAEARIPIAHATMAFDLPHEDLVAEGLAWQERSRTLLVSSVRERKIIAISESGASSDFVAPRAGGVGALLGMAADGERLWVTMATMPPMLGFDPKAPRATALLAYDLATRKEITRVDLPSNDGVEHALTDVCLGMQGEVFVADSAGAMIYELAAGATRLTPLVPPGIFVSPQTPAMTPDGRRLYVPDYVRGIASVDLASGGVSWVVPAPSVALDGIDDLHVVGRDLVAIQNGATPPRIVRISLDENGRSATRLEILERAAPGVGAPTHGVVRDGRLWFIAEAGWERFDDEGAPRKNPPPDSPRVMSLPL